MLQTMFRKQFSDVNGAWELAQAIVDTVREPILVLDAGLRVIAASRSFYSSFKVNPEETQGRLLYALGDGQWDIHKRRVLLEQIVPKNGTMRDYEVEHDFPDLGQRTMCLNARQVFYGGGVDSTILLGIEDVTERRATERRMEGLLREKETLIQELGHRMKEKETLLQELEHRVANSLQVIASIILMKARAVDSEETRLHLHDAHKRVISVAAVQKQLHPSAGLGRVEMAPYLSSLCGSLASSIIGDTRSISLKVSNTEGSATLREAESLGLITTELIMNACKHAFPREKTDARIIVAFEVDGTNWKLTVTDNGIGKVDGVFAQPKTGLGTGIVKALAQQLEAIVETTADRHGTSITITHATFLKKDKSDLSWQATGVIHDGAAIRIN